MQLRLRASELHALTFARQVDGYELARRAGFDHHLVKPADTTVLASLLEAAAEAATA